MKIELRSTIAAVLAACVWPAANGCPSIGIPGGSSLVDNGSFEKDLSGWNVWQGTFDPSEDADGIGGSLRLERRASDKDISTAYKTIEFDSPVSSPLAFGFRVKAGVLPPGSPTGSNWLTYHGEVSLSYADGTGEYVQLTKVPVSDGTGWEAVATAFVPKKPVVKANFYAHLRAVAKVWVDDAWAYAFPAAKDGEGCRLTEKDGAVTLENDYVRCVFEPARGGTCREFTVKATGQNYAGPRHFQSRLFAEQFRTGGLCFNRGFKYEILRNDPEEASVRMMLADPEGHRFLHVLKTFTLRRRSSALGCVYGFRNDPASMGELIVEPRFRHGWSARDVPTQCFYAPTAKGVVTFRPKDGDCYVTNAVAGWMAAATGKGGGLIAEFDLSRVGWQYGWMGGQDECTSEWMFSPTAIACGKTFETPQTFYPFSGKGATSAENGIVSSITSDEEGRVQIEFSSAAVYTLDAEVVFVWKDGRTRSVVRKLALSPDYPIVLRTGVARGNGLKSIRVLLRNAGQVVHEAFRTSDANYEYPLRQPKVKPAEVKVSSLDLSTEIETPHVVWARPFAGGRPKVLFITDYLHAREIVELKQRFDLDPRAVRIAENWAILVWGSPERFGTYTYEESNIAIKNELARPLDAIVVASDVWAKVDEANKAKALELAKKGTGLVIVGDKAVLPKELRETPTATAFVKSGMDAELLIGGADAIRAFERADGGRVVHFGFEPHGSITPFISYKGEEPPFRYQDYMLGAVAKAIVWAAKMDVKAPADAKRREEIVDVQPGFAIRHTFFEGPKGVYDWQVATVHTITDGRIEDLALTAEGLKVGGAVKIVAQEPRKLHVDLYDGSPRLIARRTFDVKPGENTFSITAPENPFGVFRVTATLLGADGRPAARVSKRVLSPIIGHLDENYPVSMGLTTSQFFHRRYLWPYRAARYRDLGVTDLRDWDTVDNGFAALAIAEGFPVDYPATSSVHLWKFTENFFDPYAKTKDRKYLVRKPCFDDPAYRTKDRRDVVDRVRTFSRYSPPSFDFGDEGCLTDGTIAFDFCFCDHTMKAEREWLKKEYGSLEALNASWKTAYRDWNDVTPLIEEDAVKAHGKDRQWASWSDHRRYMEHAFCGYYRTVKEQVREVMPGMPMDLSGTRPPNGWTGFDFYLMKDVWDIVSAYTHENQCEIVRSFGRHLSRPWHGYGREGPDQFRDVWIEAFRAGNCGTSWFDDMNILEPDYRVSHQVRSMQEMVKDLKAGGGMILKRAVDERPEVLIHYSMRSYHVAQIEKRHPALLAARDAWCKILEDAFIPYRFVATEEIEAGELERNPAKVLVLTVSSAVTDREAEAIRAFVKRGGLVVYDEQPGAYDGHANLRAQNVLDDVLAGEGAWRPDMDAFLRYTSLRKAVGERAKVAAFLDAFRTKIAGRRIDCGVKLSCSDFGGAHAYLYRDAKNAAARYLGLVAELESNGSDGVTDVKLDEPKFVYDMRAKKCLGRTDSFRIKLGPAETAFYAMLPYEVKDIAIKVPERVAQGAVAEIELSFDVAGSAAALHPVKLEVFDAKGDRVWQYSRVVGVTGGRMVHPVRLALNDRTGAWRVEATDFVTGRRADARFEVSE